MVMTFVGVPNTDWVVIIVLPLFVVIGITVPGLNRSFAIDVAGFDADTMILLILGGGGFSSTFCGF